MSAESRLRDHETLAVAVALTNLTLGGAVLLVLPGLVGALKEAYGFDESQLGYLSSADLGGLTVGSALAARFIPEKGIRQGVRVGLLIAAVANLAAVSVSAYWPLLTLRVMAGLGAGFVVAACYIVLGQSKHVDRNFSFACICQLIFGAVVLQIMPVLSDAAGVGGVFALLAGLFAIALLLLRYVPSSSHGQRKESDNAPVKLAAWTALAALLGYFVAQGAVWAYLELIGERGGIGRQTVATGVAVSSLAGLLGPMTAAMLGPRFGRTTPLFAGVCVSLVALYLLGSPLDSVRYISAACLFNIAWNFTAPYQLACTAAVDPSGRAIALAASVSLAGVAIGPVAAALILSAAGFGGVLWLSAGLCILSFVGFIPALSKQLTAST